MSDETAPAPSSPPTPPPPPAPRRSSGPDQPPPGRGQYDRPPRRGGGVGRGRTPHPLVKSVMYLIASFISLTWHCVEFWCNLFVYVALHRMSESELLGTSIVLLGTYFGLDSLEVRETWRGGSVSPPGTEGADGGGAIASWGLGGADGRGGGGGVDGASQPSLSVPLTGVGISCLVLCVLSVHIWFHLMSVGFVENSNSPLLALGIVVVLVADSVVPWIILLTGIFACWTGVFHWLVGMSATAVVWFLTSFATGLVRSALYRGLQGPTHGGYW